MRRAEEIEILDLALPVAFQGTSQDLLLGTDTIIILPNLEANMLQVRKNSFFKCSKELLLIGLALQCSTPGRLLIDLCYYLMTETNLLNSCSKTFKPSANILHSKVNGFKIKIFKPRNQILRKVIGFPFPRQSAHLVWVRGELSEARRIKMVILDLIQPV